MFVFRYSAEHIIQVCWRLQLLQMGKKIIKETATSRRTSTRVIKKKQHPQEEQFYQEQQSNQELSPHDDRDSDQENSQEGSHHSAEQGSNQDMDEEDDESSISQVKPENLAIRNMQFRERRGTKMNYLINRKKQEQQDSFWADKGNQYFGDLDDGDNDQQDYVQSSSGRDQFDSDFNQTQSEHNEEQGQAESEKQVDEDHQKQKKKRQELMRKIQAPAPGKKGTAKSVASSTIKKVQKEGNEATSKYIHMAFNQQQLLGEAATTEYYNWLSLKKLISIQTEKKDFTKRQHHIEGPKIIYRDRINQLGFRQSSYQLQNITIKKIQDLTQLMNQN